MINYKYKVEYTSNFKKCLKRINKQNKNIEKLFDVVDELAYDNELEEKFKNHSLINDKYYKNCKECHIENDWLLIYKYIENNTILLIGTGRHSELFK